MTVSGYGAVIDSSTAAELSRLPSSTTMISIGRPSDCARIEAIVSPTHAAIVHRNDKAHARHRAPDNSAYTCSSWAQTTSGAYVP